jgi:hypothetical protein
MRRRAAEGGEPMKTGAVNDVLNALLFGLPQGMLLAVIWIAYSVWMILTMRRFVAIWSPSQFSRFASTFRRAQQPATGTNAPQPTAEQTEQHI